MTKILFAACAMLAIHASAGVDLSKYMGAAVPKSEAKAVLEKVFMHDPSVLDKVDVEVADMQERKNGVKVVFMYVGRMSTQMNSEIYVVSLDKAWNTVDGMMLGYTGDAQLLKLDMPDGYYYETNPSLPYSIVSDTLTCERTYRYGTSKQGEKYFNQQGTVTSAYLISPTGVFTQLPITVKATESRGDVGGEPVSGETEGLFSKYGVQILEMMQRPVSAGVDMDNMTQLAGEAMGIVVAAGDEQKDNAETHSVEEFATWSTAMGLRNADVFLPWIADNNSQALAVFVSLAAKGGEFFESTWLKGKVNALNDKKSRQWWQKWLSEQGL